MARKDDIRRRWGDEEETATTRGEKASAATDSEKLIQQLQQIDPLIDQVNSLYNQYIAGIERLPPIERRKILEQMMDAATAMAKTTPSARFRFSGIQARYISHRDRWDKLMKDLEAGKIKRR